MIAFSHKLKTKIPVDQGIKTVSTDNLQNVYVCHTDHSISKYDKAGTNKATVNFKSYGELTHLDATNPFMIYLFYRNQNALLITDNFLNLRSTIKLDQLESDFISVLGRSVDDGIWIFDLNDYQLKKYDQSLNLQQSSGNVMSWIEGEADFVFLVAERNYVYVNSPSNGILVFDQFANYYKKIPLKNLNQFQVFEGSIYFQNERIFQRYTPKFLKYDTLYTCDNDSLEVVGNNQSIVEFNRKALFLSSLN